MGAEFAFSASETDVLPSASPKFFIFVKILFFDIDTCTKRLITYQSEQQSMMHLFIYHQLCLSEYFWKVGVTFQLIYFVIVPLCEE